MCCVTLDHGGVQGPRELLLCTSFREAEVYIAGHSSVPKHLLWIHAWLGRFPHSSISSLLNTLSSAHMVAFLTSPGHMTESWLLAGMASTLYTSPHGRLLNNKLHTCLLLPLSDLIAKSPSLSAHPHFKCSSRDFLCDLASGPSYDVVHLPITPYLLPSFSCHL